MVANVFVSSTQQPEDRGDGGERGFLETATNGDRFLVLLNGRRYEGMPGTAEYKISEFERYAMRIEQAQVKASRRRTKSLPTLDLLRSHAALPGELAWRIGLPLSALVLALACDPAVFRQSARRAASLNLVLAVLIYMIYNN